MGLDTVELVMAFEEEFEIEIPDASAEEIVTVGDVVDFVAAEFLRRGEKADSVAIYHRVKGITVRHLSVDPDKITRSSRFVEDLGAD